MNNTQTQQSAGGSNFAQTQNPQTIPVQSLGAPETNLQAPASSLLFQTGLKITGVSGAQFNPTTLQVATESSPQAANNTSSAAPLMIGGSIVLAVLAALVILAVKKGKPAPSN